MNEYFLIILTHPLNAPLYHHFNAPQCSSEHISVCSLSYLEESAAEVNCNCLLLCSEGVEGGHNHIFCVRTFFYLEVKQRNN